MILYNTTFLIQKEILKECLDYLKTHYIPNATNSGLLYDPRLRRILNSEEEEDESFSVQFNVKDIETLNRWSLQEGGALQQELVGRFKEKVVGFSTLLEEISLKND